MHRIDSDGATPDNKFTDNPAPGQNATVISSDWLNSIQEEIAGFMEAHGVTLAKADNTQLTALMASLFSAAKKVAGEYEIEAVLIPGTTDKKIMVTNKQTGKAFTITETRAPAGVTAEATHSLGAVADGTDYIFDFSLHNYSGAMKGVFVLSVFNADTKMPIQWVLKRRPTGQTGYGDTEDHYMMQLSEANGLEINTGGETGPLPTWSKVLTTVDKAQIENDFFKPRGVIPAGNGNLISYWQGVLPGIYYAGPGRVTDQPSDYGIVIVEKDGPISSEIQITWKTQSNGNVYRKSCNGSNISAWETYVTTTNILDNGAVVKTSNFVARYGVGVSASVHANNTTFGALWSLFHGPLSGAAGSHMLVCGSVIWNDGSVKHLIVSKAVRESNGSITLLGFLASGNAVGSINLTNGGSQSCNASLAC